MAKQNIELGSVHPQYGGRRVDLMTLPDGYMFQVANGCWWGTIGTQDGKRYMEIQDTGQRILITEENRYSLWLEISEEEFKELYPDVMTGRMIDRAKDVIIKKLKEESANHADYDDYVIDTDKAVRIMEAELGKPSEPAISRDAVIKLLNERFGEYSADAKELTKAVKALPLI